ncbi:MAG: hypothetical protein A3F16_00740 [Deltaproteobacteria bacterium RIFCSPHIGHO2_12_FULL_43_9]|nr:MAG: hypothetical protein A3F16_00740 [Deltaproteobacteria bacterium RIFCSPHIGHO2_12_FULL_43_9]
MKFIKQALPDVYLIEPEPAKDHRGLLRRHFCKREFDPFYPIPDINQSNISENLKKKTLRGFHYQKSPHGESRLISCVKGGVYDIVVDLRPTSRTFCKWISTELTEDNRLSLFVPDGCANAFLTLENNSWMLYLHTGFYVPGFEGGVRYNDPYFNFKWPTKPEVISERDGNIPLFNPGDFSL